MAPQVRFVGTVSVKETVPVNPLIADTVIVEVADVPTVTAAGDVAETEKSVTVNVAVVECDNVPLVPVIVNVYVAATVELQDTVAVPELVTLLGVMAPQVRFVGTVSVKETVPVNPLIADTVIVEVADVPTVTAAGDVAETEKSVTVNVAVVECDNVPLVPVIVNVYVAATVELQDTVAVPELVTLLGVMAPQVRFVGTVSVKETVPVNPLIADTVIVEVADVPTVTAAGDVAETEKSVTVNVAVVECDNVPLVPVIVNVYVAATVELQDTVAVPEFVTLLGVIAPQVKPVGTVSVRVTVPVNPLRAVTVIVEVADVPAVTVAGEVAATLKSVTMNVAVAECDRVPLVPVTVRT